MKADWLKGNTEAVLFDLDGVLTATAKIHAICWKRMFDAYLKRRAALHNVSFSPFDTETDYKAYVDGKLRYDGVASFLQSRGIELPLGTPDDDPELETVCGLGNRKDRMVSEILARETVEVFEGSVRLVHWLKRRLIRLAVVSASKNCGAVLAAAGITDLFEVRVDGVVAEQMNLPGKPAPDTFLHAAGMLGVEPERAIVVEDAMAGVEAGRSGGFGLVVGVARHGNADALRASGADLVVSDLSELLPESEQF